MDAMGTGWLNEESLFHGLWNNPQKKLGRKTHPPKKTELAGSFTVPPDKTSQNFSAQAPKMMVFP